MLTSAVIVCALAAIAAAQLGEGEEVGDYSPAITPDVCQEKGICVEGRGLQLYSVGMENTGLYKGAEGNWVDFPRDAPAKLKGRDFLTYDNYPVYAAKPKRKFDDNHDTRIDEIIQRMQSDKEGELVIALSSADAAGSGWDRVNTNKGADFVATSDGGDLDYWIYTYDYTKPQTWVELPKQDEDASPAFAFGDPEGTLSFANPLPLPNGGIIISTGSLVTNPGMCIVPAEKEGENDVFLATATGIRGNKVWRSTDKGKTWEGWSNFKANLNRHTIFPHNGSVYIMATLKHPEKTDDPNALGIMYKSDDGGQTFDQQTLLPFDGGDAPAGVVEADGRLWKAIPGPDSSGAKGSTLVSAPVDSDLMDVDSWTVAKVSQGAGNEGTTMKDRSGTVVNVAKSDGRSNAGLVFADGYLNTKFDEEKDIADVELHGKFTMLYDQVSDKYWALTNSNGQPRNTIDMYSSDDARSWTFVKEVLYGPSSRYHGWNYPSMLFDGDDIVFVLRTAWETPFGHNGRWHDGNVFSFHRVANFRGDGECTDTPGRD